MKIIYTICFFADTILLLVLASAFFKRVDTGAGTGSFLLLGTAILCSIAILAFLLFQYIKIPPSDHQR